MDISNFMVWFLNQCVSIFSYTYLTMANITFMGTNLLQVVLTISILGAILPVLLTIVNTQSVNMEKRDRARLKQEQNQNSKGGSRWI